jgi:hypothetical protein
MKQRLSIVNRILLLLVASVIFTSCEVEVSPEIKSRRSVPPPMYEVLFFETHGGLKYIRDVKTDVMYIITQYDGGISVMLNKEGKALTYAEYKRLH